MEDEQTNRTKSASEDSFYIKELKQGNIKAFEFLFNKYLKFPTPSYQLFE